MAHIYEKKSLKMTGLYVVFDRGGLYDADGEYGTSHLMEHLICKTFKDEYSILTKNAIDWNAYTADEQVVVHFTGMDKYLNPEFKERLVKKLLGGISISKEEFEVEKNVVLQEYMDSFNDPETTLNLIREKYDYYCPIGRKADIENFTYEDMQRHYALYYTNPAKIVEVGPTKSDFSFVTYQETPKVQPRKIKWIEKNKNIEKEAVPENHKATLFYIGKKNVSKADYPALMIAIFMLAGGMESPMFKRIREEKGLTYGIASGATKFIKEAVVKFGATTDFENKQALQNEFEYFFNDIKLHLTKERFEDVIQCLSISEEKKKIFRYKNVDDVIRKGYIMIGKAYKKLTLDKVQEVAAKYINKDNMKLFIL